MESRRRRRRHGSARAEYHTYRAIAEALEPRRMLAANLVISEFMASNSNSITDSFGDHSDWIEIHNAGDAAANLNDYFLTDNAGDPEEWRFPSQTLAAGGYLIVFASGRDISVAGQELHTNFKLSADGEYLALVNAADDSVQFAYSPEFPPQTANVSYGLSDSDDPNSAEVYFSVPTPGAPNAPSVAEPTYSVAGKTFTGSLQVTLSDSTPGAVIHYTTDGTSPTASSPVYATTLTLTNTTMLRTMATASGYTSSPVTSQSYIALDATTNTSATLGSSSVSTFTSNLPIVMIDTFGTTISDTVDNAASVSFIDTTNGTANALGASEYIGRAGFRIRGSTSESYPKKQYALELWDETNDDKKESLLGMPSDSDWVLYAPYTEEAMMQNALAYEWANETGHYASRTQYVEVFLNTSSVTAGGTASPTTGADYIGVYILEEKIKVDSNRVDVPELSASNPAGGFIVAQDRYTGNDYFTTPQGVHMVLKDPDDTSLESTMQTEWDNFENALFTGSAGPGQPWDTPGNPDYYGNFIDIGSFVDYYLVNEMTRNIDAFWLSTYYTMGAGTVVNGVVHQGLISAGPIWDFNLSMGTPNYQLGEDSEGWDTSTLSPAPGAAGVSGFNPQDAYFQRLLTDPNFQQAVADRWEQLRSGVFSTSQLMSDVDANVAILANGTTNYPVGAAPTQPPTDPIVRNFIRWPELGTAVTTDADYDPAGSWIQDVNIVKNWLTARVNWMDSQFIPPPTVTPGGDFSGPTSVSMTPIGPATTTDVQLIGPNSTVFYKVPSANISNWQTLSATTLPSGWTQGTTGLGYDTTTTGTGAISFLPYITTNLQSQMLNKRATVYTLMNFTISNPSQIEALILKAYYDDGFIAWVNGVRVIDVNSPENTTAPGFTTTAAGSGDDTLAITDREFDITSVKSLLKVGNNTLAIQGLNSGTGSEDFLLDPTLYARTYSYPSAGQVYYTTDGSDPRTSTGAINPTAKLYTAALALSSSTKIQARTLVNGVWSALATQTYDFDSSSLRITELMYDPPAGGAFTQQDYEYVEVQNVSGSPLNLNGFAFTDAVTFTFPNATLAPGAYGVVVKNPAAFAARYGSSPNVLGTYSGSFDNSGEHVEIQDGFAQDVEDFTYSPSWYASTVGKGSSLVVVNPTGATSALNTAAGWRASYAPDGAPGIADSDSTIPSVTSWNVTGTGGSPVVRATFGSTVSAGSPATLSVVNRLTGATISPITPSFDGSTISFAFPAGTPAGLYTVTLPASNVFNVSGIPMTANATFTFLYVPDGATLSMPSNAPAVVVQQLVMGTGATLDLGTAQVLFDSSRTPLSVILPYIQSAYDGGKWDGTGITSSYVAGSTVLSLAYADGNVDSVSGVAPGQILVKPALSGDANLDGKVNIADLSVWNNNFGMANPDWTDGDFNYDGKVNIADLSVWNNNFGATMPAPAPTAPAVAQAPTQSDPQPVTAAATPAATVASPTVSPDDEVSSSPAAPSAKETPAPAATVTTDVPSSSAAAPSVAVATATAATEVQASSVSLQPSAADSTATVTGHHRHRLAPWRRIARHRREQLAVDQDSAWPRE